MAKDIAIMFAIAGAIALFILGIISLGFGVGLAIKGGMIYRINARGRRDRSEAASLEMSRIADNEGHGQYVTADQLREQRLVLSKQIGDIHNDILDVNNRITVNHGTLTKYSDEYNEFGEYMKFDNHNDLRTQYNTLKDKYDNLIVETNTLLKHSEENDVKLNEKTVILAKLDKFLRTLKDSSQPMFAPSFV